MQKEHYIYYELIAKLHAGEASKDEEAQVISWRKAKHENELEYQRLTKIWEGTSQKEVTVDVDAAWDNVSKQIHEQGKSIPKVRMLKNWWWAAAACLVLLFGLFKYQNRQTNAVVQFVEVLDKEQKVTLPDGSEVTLTPFSKLSYNKGFGDENRNIKLEGKGFFEVTKNKSLPFIIDAGAAYVQVIGTSFWLNGSDSALIKLEVETGRVWFYDKSQHKQEPEIRRELVANEWATFDPKSRAFKRVEKRPTTLKNKGVLNFENSSLKDVFNELETRFEKRINVSNKELLTCSWTARFEEAELEDVLEAISLNFDLQVDYSEIEIIVSGKGCIP